MAQIDWAIVCDLAFFDRHERLCVIGVIKTFLVPELPLALSQLMMVARVKDIQPVDEAKISIGVATPSGVTALPTDPERRVIEMSGEYILVTLREIPLYEEGIYTFWIALDDRPPSAMDVSVLTLARRAAVGVH